MGFVRYSVLSSLRVWNSKGGTVGCFRVVVRSKILDVSTQTIGGGYLKSFGVSLVYLA